MINKVTIKDSDMSLFVVLKSLHSQPMDEFFHLNNVVTVTVLVYEEFPEQ